MDSNSFDNRAGWWMVGTNAIELRVPWMLLGYSDPSTRQTFSLAGKTKAMTYQTYNFTDMAIDMIVLKKASDTAPYIRSESGQTSYHWQAWEYPAFREYAKKGFTTIRDKILTLRGKTYVIGCLPLHLMCQHFLSLLHLFLSLPFYVFRTSMQALTFFVLLGWQASFPLVLNSTLANSSQHNVKQ